MKKRLSIALAIMMLAALLPHAALADSIQPIPNVNDTEWHEADRSGYSGSEMNLGSIHVTSTDNQVSISGLLSKPDAAISLVVRRTSDESIKYLNDGKTDATGKFSFQIQLDDGNYRAEVTRSSERLTKEFTVSTSTPNPENPNSNPDNSSGGGVGSSAGGNTNTTTDMKFNAHGQIKIPIPTMQKLFTGQKPLVLENNGVQLEFAPTVFSEALLARALEDKAAYLEVTIRVLKPNEKQAVLAKSSLGGQSGLADIGGPIVELGLQWVRADGTKSVVSIEKLDEPVKVTVDLSAFSLHLTDMNQMTGIRYRQEGTGSYSLVKIGGAYDWREQSFTFHTSNFGLYGIGKAAKLTAIELTLNQANIIVNGKQKTNDVAPFDVNNRMMVPLRFIAENFGAEVKWHGPAKEVTIQLDGKTLKMTVDQLIEGFDTAPIVVNDRVMVPIRYISEQFGANVLWYPSLQKAEIVR